MVELFLILALVKAAWRFAHRERPLTRGPLPEVGDAPASATAIASPRLNDDGLATYSLDLPRTASGRRQQADRARRPTDLVEAMAPSGKPHSRAAAIPAHRAGLPP